MPVQATLSPIAGFVRGYGFRISPERIYRALSDLQINSNVNLKEIDMFKSNSTGEYSQEKEAITFGEVLDKLTITDKVKQEIRKVILDEIEYQGYNVSYDNEYVENTDTGDVTIETELVTPAPSVVKYGFTDEGYKDLKGEVIANTSDPDKILKGYSE